MKKKPQKTKKKLKNKKKIRNSLLFVTLIFLACVYISGYTYYKERFFVNSKLNGMDISKKTVQEVLDIYKEKGNAYHLSVKENGAELLNFNGTDINLQYEIEPLVQAAFAKQDPYRWWEAYFKEMEEEVVENISYDAAKAAELLKGEAFLPESNRTAPKSAEIIHDGEDFVIQKEQAGTQLDAVKLEKIVFERISKLDQNDVELTAEGCYIQPDYTEESPEVVQACQEMNNYCKAQITYKLLSSQTEQIGKAQITEWVTLGEDWKTGINQDAVKEYLNKLAKTYRGQIDVEKELPLLVDDIQNQRVTERTPEPEPSKFSGKVFMSGTYIEVDLSVQHMWYVENGKAVFECDVVTGLPTNARRTPTGQYRITEKLRNKILTGNIVPETGEPEYRTKVAYWMRITNSGVGFHDATWQSWFGGNRYKTHGSHGCINMPYWAAQQLYGMISVGTKVIIHY